MSLVGLSTSYYAVKGSSIYESVSKTAGLGFDTVEFGAAHKFEKNVWETLEKIKEDFANINFIIHGLFPPLEQKVWFNPAEGLTQTNKMVVDNLFRAAEVLEGLYISIHPSILNEVTLGGKVAGNFDEPLIGSAKDKNPCKENFIEIMNYTNLKYVETGIKVLIENMDSSFVSPFPSTEDEFLYVFHRFPDTGLLLDVGHALISGDLHRLMGLDEYIQELHLHDPGNTSERGHIAHLAIRETSYFNSIKHLLSKQIPIIFEHGADVSEEEILKESNLLQEFMGWV